MPVLLHTCGARHSGLPELRAGARALADGLLYAAAASRGEVAHGRLGGRGCGAAAHSCGFRPRVPLDMNGIARAAALVLLRMRRMALSAMLGVLAAAAPVYAQLVPITRCNAAIPCNIPCGLRPADAAGWTPGNNLGQGNTAMSLSTDFTNGITPKIDKPPISEDPVEAAARMYVRKYPAAPGSTGKAPALKGAPKTATPKAAEGPEAKPAPPPPPAPSPAPEN